MHTPMPVGFRSGEGSIFPPITFWTNANVKENGNSSNRNQAVRHSALRQMAKQAQRFCTCAACFTGMVFTADALAQAPAAPATPATPATPEDPAQVYAAAMAAFENGDYQTAVSKLEAVIAAAGPDAQLEAVYFTLGAAYFNLEQYPKAVSTLKTYLEKYPNAVRGADAKFSIAQAAFIGKDYAAAEAGFKALENIPALREKALLYEGLACKQGGNNERAIAIFEQLVQPEIKSSAGAKAALLLVSIYSKSGQTMKAQQLLAKVRGKLSFVDNYAELNALSVEMGDSLLKENNPTEALACYRAVHSREEVIKFQELRTVEMQKEIDENVADFQTDHTKLLENIASNNRLKASMQENKALLEEFKKIPDFGPALLLRVATCYYQMDRKWESIVAYEEFLEHYPKDPSREPALFGAIISSAEVNRGARTEDYCIQYQKEFAGGPNADAVGYLLGTNALQMNNPSKAETYFGQMLQKKASSFSEEIRFQLGNVRFMQAKYTLAKTDYEQYLKDYPQGSCTEEVTYRLALCSIFAGKYEMAMGQFSKYIAKYPRGICIDDAKYRLAVCKFAASLHDEVIADCKAWEAEFNGGLLLGEVLALEADALAAKNDAAAVATYIRSFEVATSNDVVNYSLFAAQKLLQRKGEWEKMGQMFESFVRSKPDAPQVIAAIYWISKARVREGKVDEAKQFIAETVTKYIGEPNRDAVEQLLTQLAQLCVRKKPAPAVTSATSSATSGTDAIAQATPPPPAPPQDPVAELDRLLSGAGASQSPTAKARILFAKAELARLRKQPAEMEKNLQAIADGFQPTDMSPMLLARVGDFLLEKAQYAKAEPIFKVLMDTYPKCDFVDFAYNGLGEIAYQNKEYEQAMSWFTDAIEKAGATEKLKDVSVGKAKTLLALGRLDEAKKAFEQIAACREWRGESTAFSVYSLGQIAEKKDDFSGAIVHYQRVYVGYRRFIPWVAKAYLKSADCFEKLGKKPEALATYREMVRNERISKTAEVEVAKKRLLESGENK